MIVDCYMGESWERRQEAELAARRKAREVSVEEIEALLAPHARAWLGQHRRGHRRGRNPNCPICALRGSA